MVGYFSALAAEFPIDVVVCEASNDLAAYVAARRGVKLLHPSFSFGALGSCIFASGTLEAYQPDRGGTITVHFRGVDS